MDKKAQNIMKLEVILKTDDGNVICHETVEENRSNTTKVQMAKNISVSHENVDQNSLYSENDKPKEKWRLSKLMSCCNSTESKESKTLVASKHSNVPSLPDSLEKSRSKESQLLTSGATIVVPERAPTSNENYLDKKPANNHSSVSFTNRMTVHALEPSFSSNAAVPENNSSEAKIMRPKRALRCDENGHWPLFDKKPSESLCKMKNCLNRTHVYCKKCDLHLCFNASRNCFYEFHKQNCHIVVGKRTPENNRTHDQPSNIIRANKSAQTSSNTNDKARNYVKLNESRLQRKAIIKQKMHQK